MCTVLTTGKKAYCVSKMTSAATADGEASVTGIINWPFYNFIIFIKLLLY